MPVERAEAPGRQSNVRAPRVAPVESLFQLPTALSVPKTDMVDYTFLIYGEKKIGKSTLAAQFPESYHLMFEPGARSLQIYQTEVDKWSTFKQALTALEAEPDRFRTIVLDTIDVCYEMCFNAVCRKRGIEHPNEERDWGQSWKAINDEFGTSINRLMKCGRGVVFISHAIEREFLERGGDKYMKIIPSMASGARKFITAPVDVIAYYGYHGDKRYITIAGSDVVECGHRVKDHFFTTEGERVHSIPCGDSEEKTYSNLLRAFENRYTRVYNPAEQSRFSNTPAPPRARTNRG